MHELGQTRGARRPDHLLQTPDTRVRTALPGRVGGVAIVHIAPAAGAGFAQYTVELEDGGKLSLTGPQCLLYVLSGECVLHTEADRYTLVAGGYAYIPALSTFAISAEARTRVAVIGKSYVPAEGFPAPSLLVGHESDIVSAALMGDEAVQVRSLLPADASFDFAVNTMTYQPGASLPQVEMHVMEHGLLMLEGGGIYRLGEHWYPVAAGDFIWMAPFCPQWFGALGKVPAKYLIYKDANRSSDSARVSYKR